MRLHGVKETALFLMPPLRIMPLLRLILVVMGVSAQNPLNSLNQTMPTVVAGRAILRPTQRQSREVEPLVLPLNSVRRQRERRLTMTSRLTTTKLTRLLLRSQL